jgi:hypothetical protein
MDNKELLWVPVELKEAWDKAGSEEEQTKIFLKAIENKKLDVKCQIESLEEDVLLFKGIGIRYKNELEKVYNEQSTQLEKIWEDFNCGDKIARQAQKIKSTLSPVIETMKSINKEFDSVSTYKVENLISVIEKFNNMTAADKKLLEILLNSQKQS